MKECTKCDEIKSLNEFGKKSSAWDGLTSECKKCKSLRDKQYRLNNIERLREYDRNRDRKEYIKEYNSRIETKKLISERNKHKRKNDINFKLADILRGRLRKAINGLNKSGSHIKDLGCSIEFLKQYLEQQFQEGMSWNNYGNRKGQWSIDHIIALSTVDLTNHDQFLKVVHYTNLRPLWTKDQILTYHKEQKYWRAS